MNKPVLIIFQHSKRLVASRLPLFVLLLVVLLLSACGSQNKDNLDGPTDARRAAKSNTSLGLEYMNRGQYEVALGKLKKAIREDPKYAPAHTVTAVLYERIGELDLAGKHYREAFIIDPKDGDVNNNYGVYLCKTGMQNQAISHFLAALEDPFYSSPSIALTNAGSCAMDRGELSMADSFLRRALKIEPELPDALMNMARLNYREQNYLKSRAFMQRYEAVAEHEAHSLLLAYKIEIASSDPRAAYQYKYKLESSFPETEEAAEVRRMSGK